MKKRNAAGASIYRKQLEKSLINSDGSGWLNEEI